jgi:hypothetical protein
MYVLPQLKEKRSKILKYFQMRWYGVWNSPPNNQRGLAGCEVNAGAGRWYIKKYDCHELKLGNEDTVAPNITFSPSI